jgi:phage repressor protein C with HTH and peptisase S24 domain
LCPRNAALIKRQSSKFQTETLPIVTAGQTTIPADLEEQFITLGDIGLPDPDAVDAFRVEGTSQWPRFQEGEFVLVERVSRSPEQCLNRYVMVQLMDGRRMLKTLRKGTVAGRYMLESHNAPPETNVDILGCWLYVGTLAR